MRNGDIIGLIYSGLTHKSRGNHIPGIDDCEMLIDAATLLASRLERLSADSIWAHRASGIRGALLRAIETMKEDCAPESRITTTQLSQIKQSINWGFDILEKAALEMIQ